ncbi:unnamed protein product [Rotaria magnacalcarata]|uniref:Reverse transcriptase domain-containing protein n=2 Tax=Rotaria magnacalcarata TaxID=392030 RepID=A0A816W6W6_9BILA|nr:unnamed protein product [Rotaria magnacalcarata]CAF4184858.1 unnamed protein product [Rotaria magnacalcarata]
MFLGGWNVRSCFRRAKKELVIKQLKKHRIQVAALSETSMYNSGITIVDDYTMIYSGVASDNKTRLAHGVAVRLNKQAIRVWKDSGAVWEAVNERIIMVRLGCKPINISLIAVYAPTNPSKGQKATIDESNTFYINLQETVDKVPKGDMLMIVGDFNARVGKQDSQEPGNAIGPYTVDSTNENGKRLIDFCNINNLIVANTFFQHKPVHQTSWMHPEKKVWHMLDYTVVNRKFRSSVEDLRVHRMAAGTIGTDHHLLRAKVKIHLRSRKKSQHAKRIRLDCKKLRDENVVDAFQKGIKKMREAMKNDTMTVNQKYANFVKCVKGLGQQHFQQEQNNHRKQKEWLTDEILDIVNKKGKAFLNWQNNRGTRLEQKHRGKYRMLRKLVKIKVDARQTEYWDEVTGEIEKAIKQHDPATAYAMIRRLRGGNNKNIEYMPIQNKNGDLLTNSADRLSRWREYLSELLNVHTSLDPSIIQQIDAPPISKKEQEQQDKPPSLAEVQEAIRQMKSRKAPGNDGITADLLKAGGLPVAIWLHEIFVDIWKQEEIVEDWALAILIRLYKNKGDKKICDNYRGISLLVVASKIFSRVILNRVQILLDNKLLEQQAGFRSNRSTIDQIFTLKLVMEKSREHNKPLCICFIDIQKAYDSVNRELLWKICRSYGLTDKTVLMLKLLYKNSKAQVRINDELSDSFDIETGVMQGGIPSPILFNILFDYIMRKVIEEANVEGIKLGYGTNDFFHTAKDIVDELNILTLMYADDVAVMCNNANDLEKFIKTFEKVTQEFGLTMSVKKTCIMSLKQLKEDSARRIIKDEEVDIPDIDIVIRNQKVDIVESFAYLGCFVSRDQSPEKETETRIAKASTAFNMLRNAIRYRKSISIEAKLRIFRACVIPVLLYGSEVWSLTVVQERRLNTFYMTCLRTIIGVNLGDKMANETILDLTGQPCLENIMRRNRLRWFGHVNRMENSDDAEPRSVKKTMFSYFPDSKRPRNGGVRKRWEDKIMDDIGKFHIKNWRRDILNKDQWRALINKDVHMRPIHSNIKGIVHEYKDRAQKRRANVVVTVNGEMTVKTRVKVTEVLAKNQHNDYACPKCHRTFKPQGITNHVKSCAKEWCQKNGINN